LSRLGLVVGVGLVGLGGLGVVCGGDGGAVCGVGSGAGAACYG
jgi:hypothetical protein